MDQPWESVHTPKKRRLHWFFFHLKNGLHYRIPICCILRFAIESELENGKTFYYADGYRCSSERRGIIRRSPFDRFVPCDVFHHRTHDIDDK